MRSTLGIATGGCAYNSPAKAALVESEKNTPRALISWRDVSTALDELVASAQRSVDVFDHSLALQDWGSKARCDALAEALAKRGIRVRFMLVNSAFVSAELPRLMRLLKDWEHRMAIMVAPEAGFPTGNFVVVDQQHLLFRPNSVRSDGSVYFHNPYKSMGYVHTFEVSWQQSGPRVFPETFGL
jgi:hypothetical protein